LSIIGVLVALFWFKIWRQAILAEVLPDHVKLCSRWWPKLVDVRYEQIVRLEKIPDHFFTGVFKLANKTHKIAFPARSIAGADELEELLRNRTGLAVGIRESWLLKYANRLGVATRLDEPGGWWKHYVFLLIPLIGGTVGLVLAGACFFLFYLFGAIPPLWLLLMLSLGSMLVTWFYLERWLSRRTGRERQDDKA
jgi:hypothetical protein